MNTIELQKVAEYLRLYNVFFVVDWSKEVEQEFQIPTSFNSEKVCFLVKGAQRLQNTANCTEISDLMFTFGMLYERLST
jgi:hypothetical protein